jgi:asparagine synthase (glutamine-hydrolysing)
MSVQFGRWNFAGQRSAPGYIDSVSATLAPYGPDANGVYSKGGIEILYGAFNTTKDSCRETQPHISTSGAVVTWDGRLDNRGELIKELRDSVSLGSTDIAIVAAACERWGINCFAKLIGDWALSIWNPNDYSLILARDPVGQRHLYYSIDKDHVTWSTILDPLVLFAGKTFAICEEYIAEWLAVLFPAPHLTPYVGIKAVPPSAFVLFRPGQDTVSKYWDFDPGKEIRYRTDAEYEEHFRCVFAKAVQRRLRSDRPVLAELSGGMDSTSIVCVSDIVISCRTAEAQRVDTISWYDDSTPDLDERPYFTKVEEKRGRPGCHIDLASPKDTNPQEPFGPEFANDCFAVTPYFVDRQPHMLKQYATHMRSEGHRITLSGIGGSEFLGDGAPTPILELQDLLARAQLLKLARQLNAWAARMSKPRWPLLWEALRAFFPLTLAGMTDETQPPSWFHPRFVRLNHTALGGSASRVKLFGSLPSFQSNIVTLDDMRRLLAYRGLRRELLREVRYPYLDRDLLEFTFALPREQIVRVGQRRSLMKRALVGIVPNEILSRRRKASLPQAPKKSSHAEWSSLEELKDNPVPAFAGIVDSTRFFEILQSARRDGEVPMRLLRRTLALEFWLRHISFHGILTASMSRQEGSLSLEAKKLQAHPQAKSSAS